MYESILPQIADQLGTKQLIVKEEIQTLWSGYGHILRVRSTDQSYVIKCIKWPSSSQHPRGWNTTFSHQRKVKSYAVEMAFYQHYSNLTSALCKVPRCYLIGSFDEVQVIVMEDLFSSGYSDFPDAPSEKEILMVLKWLANFHATFLQTTDTVLWNKGTYWHLDTRPDEWKAMEESALKANARAIDQQLSDTTFHTFVHGDAKAANFTINKRKNSIAAVDFQYIGKGCGMKDVAYFLGSCLYERDLEKSTPTLLHHYFHYLKLAVEELHPSLHFEALQNEWEPLYAFACADFERFLLGWNPGHWKMNEYSARITRKVIESLKKQ